MTTSVGPMKTLVAVTVTVALLAGCGGSSDASETTTTLSRAELNAQDRADALATWGQENTTTVTDFVVRVQGIEDRASYTGTAVGSGCHDAAYSSQATATITMDPVPDGELQARMADALDDLRAALEACETATDPTEAVETAYARADVVLLVMREINTAGRGG